MPLEVFTLFAPDVTTLAGYALLQRWRKLVSAIAVAGLAWPCGHPIAGPRDVASKIGLRRSSRIWYPRIPVATANERGHPSGQPCKNWFARNALTSSKMADKDDCQPPPKKRSGGGAAGDAGATAAASTAEHAEQANVAATAGSGHDLDGLGAYFSYAAGDSVIDTIESDSSTESDQWLLEDDWLPGNGGRSSIAGFGGGGGLGHKQEVVHRGRGEPAPTIGVPVEAFGSGVVLHPGLPIGLDVTVRKLRRRLRGFACPPTTRTVRLFVGHGGEELADEGLLIGDTVLAAEQDKPLVIFPVMCT